MGTPSDWVSGERVFAPPTGTFDVDWLVPAVVEAVPGCAPAEARAALLEAWQDAQAGRGSARSEGSPADLPPPAGVEPAGVEPAVWLREVADRVVAEALLTFRA